MTISPCLKTIDEKHRCRIQKIIKILRVTIKPVVIQKYEVGKESITKTYTTTSPIVLSIGMTEIGVTCNSVFLDGIVYQSLELNFSDVLIRDQK